MIIFENIEELKKTVKINASMPWESISPFVDDAFDLYFRNFLGNKFAYLISDTVSSEMDKLKPYLQRALGPMAVLLGTPEMSINIGDTGHTVQRTDKLAPASDAKIEKVIESLEFRAWNNVERLLEFLEENVADYPEWKKSTFYSGNNNYYLNSAREFQDLGKVNINYSRLTFEAVKPAMAQLELRLRRILTTTVDERLRAVLNNPEGIFKQLIDRSRIWIACKTAVIYTSQTTRIQRTAINRPEWKPVIYPLYNDLENTGNFYDEQAALMEADIIEIMNENADELGIEKIEPMNWNSDDKKIFCDIG